MQGRLGTPEADRFSYGVNLWNASQGDTVLNWASDAAGYLAGYVGPALTFHGAASTGISPEAVLDMVKLAIVGADPNSPDRAIYLDDPEIAVVSQAGGGVVSGTPPPQLALAVSLMTARRGPTGKGRFYIPLPELTVVPSDSFRISTIQAEGVRGTAQTFLNSLNLVNLGTANFPEVAVISSKGYATRVAQIRVGRVLDTMRSRRNKMPEAYTAAANIT